MRLVWLPEALAEREAAIDYIATDNIEAALSQLDAIERQTNSLTDHPGLGRKGRRSDTRELVLAGTPFILVYRVTATRVEVLSLLHGARHVPCSA